LNKKNNDTYILGINAYHGDSSACILKNGKLIAAAEEERFNRKKHWAGFPTKAIKYCIMEASISFDDIKHVAINSNPKSNLIKKIFYLFYRGQSFKFFIDRFKNKYKRIQIHSELLREFDSQKLNFQMHYIDHHLAHMASAYYASPFQEAIVLSVDGFGDFSSGSWGVASKNTIDVKKRIYFPHSLGVFYQAITQFIGFPNYGDEYKVMGLAPYGKDKFLNKMREIVKLNNDGSYTLNLKYFVHHNTKVDYRWNDGSPVVGKLFSDELANLLGVQHRNQYEEISQVHKDIAHSAQKMYEEAFFHMLNKIQNKYKCSNLALSGGCAMNSVANGKIYSNTLFKEVYIQAAAGDAGGAVGAAYEVARRLNLISRDSEMSHAYWGPKFSKDYIANLLNKNLDKLGNEDFTIQSFKNMNDIYIKTASAIASGKVIGWFQGRMEWGPRALGNRSIIGDPRRKDMKDILNLKIKRRESFRPFAPSILRESVSDWFETDSDVPFMMQVFQIKEEKRSLIPAVTHVDGSGRLQTVTEESNKRYYLLIKEFKDLTGVPILLNTSFNENEPVVCSPDEALETFMRTKMDVIVLENFFISRN